MGRRASNSLIEKRFTAIGTKYSKNQNLDISLLTVPSPSYDVPTFNLSLAELAGYLRHRHQEFCQEGISFIEPDISLSSTVELKETNGLDFILEKLNQKKPHIIGISAKIGATQNLYHLLNSLKKIPWTKDSIILVGNVLATFSHDILSKKFPEALYTIGDGELTLDSVVSLIKNKKSNFYDVENIAFRSDDFQLIKTKRKKFDHTKQFWLPAFDSLDECLRKKADITFRATTGCSASCTFCSINLLNRYQDDKGQIKNYGWQAFPPERTAEIFKVLSEKKVASINFADDEFGNVNFSFIEDLADRLIAQNNTITFNISMRLDAFWSSKMTKVEQDRRRKILKKLKRAKLKSMFVGAESASPTQLLRYGKGYLKEVNIRSLEIILQEGVMPQIGFIPIDHFSNRWELQENMDFLKSEINSIPLYRLVSSPINVMRVQRETGYKMFMEKKGLLGPIEDNLTFYHADFMDPRIKVVADMLSEWYRDVIDVRYKVLQFLRISKDNSFYNERFFLWSEKLISKQHLLDIRYLENLVESFPVDEFDLQLKENKRPIASLFSSENFSKVQKKWQKDLVENSKLHVIKNDFIKKRTPIISEMRELLEFVC
ncbi:MAG: hypothetical protein CMP11_03755 [Zetaproteobacteria bacterium]|nr:hypothetical protein [Pseudobdellovibrionaceae bacterium]|tara:strand:- start:366 stop:2174 length:1809 start_codon:yes stop_codon:yes gene_type:complete